jgi:hypothetical protein
MVGAFGLWRRRDTLKRTKPPSQLPTREIVRVTVPPVRCTCGKLLQPPPTGGFRCPFCGQTFQAAVSPAAAPAAAPMVMAPAPDMSPEVQDPPPNPELEQLERRPTRRRSGTPVVRILMWVLMSVFLTVPLIFLGVYVMHQLKQWDKKLQKPLKTVVEVKKQEPEIPDNIDWDRPNWSQFGEWSGTGGGKFGPVPIARSRVRFIMEASPSRGAKRAETANFRLINTEDTGIQSLIGGMRVPDKKEYDSYEYVKKKGWPIGTYTLQVEVQGSPAWRLVAFEDLQFPGPAQPKANKK